MKNQNNFWCCCYGNCYFQNVPYDTMDILRKILFWNNLKRKLKSKGFFKEYTLSFNFYHHKQRHNVNVGVVMETVQPFPAYGNSLCKLEINRKTRKKEKSC